MGIENSKEAPILVGAEEGKTISVVGDTYRILIGGKETQNSFAVIDMLIPPGGGPGPHSHPGFRESFYLIEGEIEVKSEVSTYTAQKGSFVEIPTGGIVHSFKNKTKEMAHMLCVVVPSGLEEFFLAIGQPVLPGEFLPAPHLDEEKIKKLVSIAEQFGTKIFPPDFLG